LRCQKHAFAQLPSRIRLPGLAEDFRLGQAHREKACLLSSPRKILFPTWHSHRQLIAHLVLSCRREESKQLGEDQSERPTSEAKPVIKTPLFSFWARPIVN